MRALKFALLGVGALLLVSIALGVYLIATFDPHDYEPRITALVKEKTGRTLRIAGDFKLDFWPNVNVKLGQVSLSERDSEERFADAESVRIVVKLRPLFSRTLVADELLVDGARVQVTRFADGRLNIDDLLKSDGPTPQFDIARVKVERSALTYSDRMTEKQYAIERVDLETGRLANVVVTPLKLSFGARDEAKTFDVATRVEGRLGIDLGERRYGVEQGTLAITGRVGRLEALELQAKATLALRLKTREAEITGVAASARTLFQDIHFDSNLELARLTFGAESIAAESLRATLGTADGGSQLRLTLASPSIFRNGEAIVSEASTLAVDDVGDGRTLNVTIASPIDADTSSGRLLMSKLEAKIALTGTGVPAGGINGVVSGKAELDAATQTARTELNGTIGGSRVKGAVTIAGFARPAFRFAVDVDQLDLDRYAPRPASGGGAAGFDLSTLAGFPATGTLHVGTLTMGGAKARNVKLAVKP